MHAAGRLRSCAVERIARIPCKLHHLRFDGIPSRAYAVQYTEDLSNPQWQTLGNLTADESLWQARIDPTRPVSSLDADERRALYRKIQKVLRDSIPYGLVPLKRSWLTGARSGKYSHCPRCGARQWLQGVTYDQCAPCGYREGPTPQEILAQQEHTG